MNYLLLICGLMLWHSTFAYANNHIVNVALTEMLPQHCLLSGDFTQTRKIHALPAPLVSSGQFFFSCHNGLIWQTKSPINETLIYTQQEHHFQIKKEHSPQLLKNRLHDNLAKILIGLMSADTRYLQKYFSIHNESNKNDDTSLILKPKNKPLKRALRKIILQQQGSLNTIKIVNINKETTQIAVSNRQHFNWQDNDHTQSSCQDFADQTQLACDILMQPQNHLTIY